MCRKEDEKKHEKMRREKERRVSERTRKIPSHQGHNK